jgi:hypothetical protein
MLLFTGDNVIVPLKAYIAFDRTSDDVYLVLNGLCIIEPNNRRSWRLTWRTS